ncbi:hypothetical protein Thermus71318_23900 [Thermus brockianus]
MENPIPYRPELQDLRQTLRKLGPAAERLAARFGLLAEGVPGQAEGPLPAPREAPPKNAVQDANPFVQQSRSSPKGWVTLEGSIGLALSAPSSPAPPLDPDCCTAPPAGPDTRLERAKALVEARVRELLHDPTAEGERAQALARIRAMDPGATPLRLLRLLVALGLAYAKRKGYKAEALSQVAFHLPVDVVAAKLRVHRATVWRAVDELEKAGLVATRRHFGTLDGRTATTGTVWAVRLKPGKRARFEHGDLAHPWRDLQEDRNKGRTAYRVLQAAERGFKVTFRLLLDWALGNRRMPYEDPAALLGREVDDLLFLAEIAPQERPTAIDRLAETIAHRLGDPGSRRYYAGLLWKVVEGALNPYALLQAIRRALIALQEGGVRRPGALVATALGRL